MTSGAGNESQGHPESISRGDGRWGHQGTEWSIRVTIVEKGESIGYAGKQEGKEQILGPD